MPTAPTKIADDLDNNSSYWFYTADSEKDFIEMKHIAQLNNFDFVNNIDLNVLADNDNQNLLKNTILELEPSGTSLIFLKQDNNIKKLYYDPNNGALGVALGAGVSQFNAGTTLEDASNSSDATKYAIFIKQNEDKTSKFDLLESQIKNNIITADNQHTALQFIYLFLIVISILSLLFNFDKIRISHIIFLVFFIGYGVFYKYISTFIVMQFKDAMISIKYSDSTSQLLSYLKVVLIATVAFVVPLLSLMLFNTSYDAPLSDVTDYTKSVVGDAVDYGSELVENSQNVINEGVSTLSDSVGDARNSIQGAAEGVSETVGDISQTVSDSANKIGNQVSTGLNSMVQATSVGPSVAQPSTTPNQASQS